MKIKDYALYLGNISKDFIMIKNIKNKTGLKEIVKFFYVDFNHIDTKNFWDIHKYLMKGTW